MNFDFYKLTGYFFASILAAIAPIKSLLLFTGFVIMLDLVTGIWASRKRKEAITSRRLERTWSKIIIYPLGIIFGHWAEVLVPEIPFVKGATLLLIIIEGKSLEENFGYILGQPLSKYIRDLVTKGARGVFESKDDDKDEQA